MLALLFFPRSKNIFLYERMDGNMKKMQITPYTYCNNPELYLRDKSEISAYGQALKEMSAEALNGHLDEMNGIAQENYYAGWHTGFKLGSVIGASVATSILCVGIGGYMVVKSIKSKKNQNKK